MTRFRCFLANTVTALLLGLTLVTGFALVCVAGTSTIVFAKTMTLLLLAVNVLTAGAGFACVWAFGVAWERATWYEPPKQKRQVITKIDGVPLAQYRRPPRPVGSRF